MKTALITGITGQDGAYLAEFLLKKGYTVHGVKRRSSLFNTDRIDHLYQSPHESNRKFILHYGDLSDSISLVRIIQQIQPDEIYGNSLAIKVEKKGSAKKNNILKTIKKKMTKFPDYYSPKKIQFKKILLTKNGKKIRIPQQTFF